MSNVLTGWLPRFPGPIGVLGPLLASRPKPSIKQENISGDVASNSQDARVSGEGSQGPTPKRSDRESDALLVERAQKGDRTAAEALVLKYQRRVYGVVFAMLHNREDALEVTQDAFVKGFKSLKNFAGRSGFYTWIYRIAVNQSIDFRRREWKRKDRTTEYDDTREDLASEGAELPRGLESSPERANVNRELGEKIQAAMDQLPDDQRAV